MKSILRKTTLLLTYVFAVLLLVSLISPYVSPKSFPTLSITSLFVLPLIVINGLIALFWLFKMRSKFFISAIVLVLSFLVFGSVYQFSSKNKKSEPENQLSLLSYNVRLFNAYEPDSNSKEVTEIISSLINNKNPDVFCIQEHYKPNTLDFSTYPFQFIHFKRRATKLGHAIFSKYPIINEGAFNFEHSNNNALFVDIVKEKDTLRVYNLHLQSLSINPNINSLQEENKDRLRKRISKTFVQQQEQMDLIIKHITSSKYPVLLCGDFNNTSFSYIHKQLSKKMKDAFNEAGKGFGGTYLFNKFPIRIDFIFADTSFEVLQFTTIKETFSDHFPIFSKVGW